MLKYVFGPVPSRRLGRSLGIDPIPLKTCNLSCVYCQLGRTHPLVQDRKEVLPADEIVAEVEEALARVRPGSVDWLTFVGSGETTLHSRLGWMIRRLRKVTELPIAVITNGSLLHREELRHELTAADAVLPSLDAGSGRVFDLVNRPHRSLDLVHVIAGLVAFRREYEGRMWLEVMLVHGLNDTETALRDLAAALRRIQPDEAQVNVPTRPPAEAWVRPPSELALEDAHRVLGASCHATRPAAPGVEVELVGDVVHGLLGILRRHPLRDEELAMLLRRRPPREVRKVLASVAESGQVRRVRRFGSCFWCAAESRFPAVKGHDGNRHPAQGVVGKEP